MNKKRDKSIMAFILESATNINPKFYKKNIFILKEQEIHFEVGYFFNN